MEEIKTTYQEFAEIARVFEERLQDLFEIDLDEEE